MELSWDRVQSNIEECRICQHQQVRYLMVPDDGKRHPSYPPPQPTKLLFISVAPPRGGSYFWDEAARDNLRDGLFEILEEATGVKFESVHQFWKAGYYLIPGVKCPSQMDGNDQPPARIALRNCASHLKCEIEQCGADRILALGRTPVRSLAAALHLKIPRKVLEYRGQLWWPMIAGRSVPVAGTYFAGNDRHQGFESIVEDIKWILDQQPKGSN